MPRDYGVTFGVQNDSMRTKRIFVAARQAFTCLARGEATRNLTRQIGDCIFCTFHPKEPTTLGANLLALSLKGYFANMSLRLRVLMQS